VLISVREFTLFYAGIDSSRLGSFAAFLRPVGRSNQHKQTGIRNTSVSVSTSRKHLCCLVVVVAGMVISNVDTMQRRIVRGFVVMSVFLTDMGKTIPVNEQNMYETFLSAKDNLKSCKNYNVSALQTDSFKGLCSLPTPDLSQEKEKIIQALKFNITPLLCYSIFHNVNAVCHPHAVKSSAKSSSLPAKPTSDQFCESITPLTLPETCTHWLEAPEETSKADCFLVNEVVDAVLKKEDFCKNKCLVPDPNDTKAPPTVNPLCEKLLDTSKILAEMPPQESQGDSLSSSSLGVSTPPVMKKTPSAKVDAVPKTKVEEVPETKNKEVPGTEEKKKESEPKSGDIDPAEEETEVTEEDEKSKEISKDEEKDKGGDIDAEKLVGVEEKDKDKDNDDDDAVVENDPVEDDTESKVEPVLPDTQNNIVETKYENNMKSGPEMGEQSSFFGYFILLSIVAIIAYLVFHNKQKILALVLEGRRRQGSRRRSGGREYRKLDSNLEDTMDHGKETSLRQVIY